MKSTADYIKEAKISLGITSDYGMAKWLGISKQAMSQYKTGDRIIDNYAATLIAKVLNIDPMKIIATAEAEREQCELRREFWRSIADGTKCVIAGCVCWAAIQAANDETETPQWIAHNV